MRYLQQPSFADWRYLPNTIFIILVSILHLYRSMNLLYVQFFVFVCIPGHVDIFILVNYMAFIWISLQKPVADTGLARTIFVNRIEFPVWLFLFLRLVHIFVHPIWTAFQDQLFWCLYLLQLTVFVVYIVTVVSPRNKLWLHHQLLYTMQLLIDRAQIWVSDL